MKNFKLLFAYLAVVGLLFTSCSQEDENLVNDTEKATLSFATVLNDLATDKAALKQALNEIPECSDEAPAFVEVVLTGPTNVGSMTNPLVVGVNPTPGNYDGDPEAEYFTEESAQLELEPGTYTLQHFVVYDGDPNVAGSNIIWVAPIAGGSMEGFVENTLPMQFNLGAGVKKYIDVEVLCFDDRLVNEYGYLFFDIEETRAIEFCIFGNYCPPSGRHYPAAFSVDVWMYENGQTGAQLYDDWTNTVALDENQDYAGTPLCIALPDRAGDDAYYIEITLLDTNSDVYGDVANNIIRSGVITDAEVRSFFDGENNLEYYHFRQGCGEDSPPIFNEPGTTAKTYKACLTPLNNSGALAFAYLKLTGNTLQASVLATGLEAGAVHPQHIHGFENKSNSTCPPASAAGDDGLLTIGEGLPFYGGPILSLVQENGDFPSADADGDFIYKRTFNLGQNGLPSATTLGPLENRTVVLHGMTVGGEYVASLPVACAEISVQE